PGGLVDACCHHGGRLARSAGCRACVSYAGAHSVYLFDRQWTGLRHHRLGGSTPVRRQAAARGLAALRSGSAVSGAIYLPGCELGAVDTTKAGLVAAISIALAGLRNCY